MFDLFRYVKNGSKVTDERTGKEYEVGGKIARTKIILIPVHTKITADQITMGKEEFNQNFYYHRDNLTDWSVFSTKQITARLNKLCS